MLSLVDLLEAGTVGLDLAAELAAVAASGGSFLTAAGPGGVGKTTLMGALLAFLPPGCEILTVEGPAALSALPPAAPAAPKCLVVHEIGSGHWYGYLWGRAVAEYLGLAGMPGRSLASNLHAETYEEAVAQLTGPPLGVSADALGRIDALAFMAAERGKRRVTSVWYADGAGGHRCAWRWQASEDRFERVGPGPAGATDACLRQGRDFLEGAVADRVRLMEDLRHRALAQWLRRP